MAAPQSPKAIKKKGRPIEALLYYCKIPLYIEALPADMNAVGPHIS